jgi:hypothetical protein
MKDESKDKSAGKKRESISGNKNYVVNQVKRNTKASKLCHVLSLSSMRKWFYEIRLLIVLWYSGLI